MLPADGLLLHKQELISAHFISFLVHKHPHLRKSIKDWLEHSKAAPREDKFTLFLKAIPADILRSTQEDFIQQGKPQAGAATSGGNSSSMSSQQPAGANMNPGVPGGAIPPQQQAALAARNLLGPNAPAGAAVPPRSNQFNTSNNAWANNAGTATQLAALQQQQQQQRTVSPGPGQQVATAAAAAGAGLNPAHQLQLQQIQIQQLQQQQQQLLKQGGMSAQSLQQLLASGQSVGVMQGPNGPVLVNMAGMGNNPQLLQLVQQQQQQQAQLARGGQQQAAQAARRPGAAAPPAAPKKQQPGAAGAGGLASSGSAGNLAVLGAAVAGQRLQMPAGISPAAAAAMAAAAQRGQQPQGMAALTAAGIGGIRPGFVTGLGARPVGVLQASAANLQTAQAFAALRPEDPPRIEAPEGHEWVRCAGKDGNPGWFALPRASAQAMRAAVKRKAEEAAGGAPAAKGGPGGVRRKVDDDVTAGADMNVLDVMGADDLQAELALNEAAKGAVVVEQGNVQEEYLLNQGPTITMVARAAKKNGVRQVGEDVYAFLSLAAEAHLGQLLHSLVKARLQREDLGKGYQGVEKLDDRLRSSLFQMVKKEKEAARKREEEERDELAKLGASRKKLAEEDKKAAKAAQNARQLEQQQKNLGSTLTKMGIGRRAFTMSSLGRPAAAGGGGGARAGFTKPELVEAKAAAANGAAAGDGDAAAGAAGDDKGAVGVKPDPGAAAAADGGSQQPGGSAAAAAAAAVGGGSMLPPLKPVTLQHQLLSVAQNAAGSVPGGGVPSFVAGGGSSGRGQDGEEGLRELMVQDLIAVLDRHPLYCRGQQLYSLYALSGHSGK